jgi:mannosyltransferase OCH1-like enzyme
MADPNLEVRPDFASNAYRMVWEALMATFNEDVEQATDRLAVAWEDEHNQRVEAWNAEREADALEAERAQLELRQREEEHRRLEEAEVERERKDTEKKKPKINDFDEDRPPPSVMLPRPSQYAIQKLITFDFVELWYFSLEGCAEAH